MVNVVRPTGGLTPARPDAVVRVGNQLQGLFWRAGSSYGERVEWRIQWWRWRRLGWPELSTTSTDAVAGVRAWAAAWFQCMGELTRGCVGLAIAPGARQRLKLERRRTVAARAMTMADGGARVWRLA